jgi:hypothetical protein
MLDSMAQIIAPEMLQHTQRWGGSPEQWQSNVQRIRDFITTRNSVIREGLAECYDLTGPFDITVTVQPEGAGQVKVNSLLLENYPWTGTYFGGIDVKLEATGINPAYEFDRWILQNHAVFPSETAPLVSLDLNQNDSIVALFKPRIFYDSLVINEINYNPADDFDPGDWVEFYNPHDYDLDITHWEFRDEDDEHSFVFPDGTVLGSKDYLVLCNDTTRFKSLFPQVVNLIGNMDFGFSGNGELIRLFDASLILIDTVHYDDSAPWPIEPDGDGPTLELINPSYDNALPQSWAASSGYGTPGTVNGTYVGVPGEKPLNRITCRIYPNPFSDRAAVAITTHLDPEGALCTIFDMFGHPVREYRLVNSWNFTVSRDGLKSGFYMFKITDRNHALLYTGKFIIL